MSTVQVHACEPDGSVTWHFGPGQLIAMYLHSGVQ